MDIKFVKRDTLKEKPDQSNLGFGKYMTDYMFVMDWDKGVGWHDARIEPYGPVEISPSCVTLHYAQETFEGLKAYRTKEDKILLFRPEMNARRSSEIGFLRSQELPFIFDHLYLPQSLRWVYTWQFLINLW